MTDRKRVFSGMQPTGEPHLGNLVGALHNWVKMQDDYETIYCVVDLHAMTSLYDPADLARERHDLARMILAAGVDPKRSLLYYQSEVPQHVELSWILGTITGIGQLERMTQFKEKSDRSGQNLGILAYPVLQAADILIHKVHAVPVGDDQAQHLELTRDIAERFNARFGEEFPIPERITPEIGARVMSLTDPTAKMSKSDPSPTLTDTSQRHPGRHPEEGEVGGHRCRERGRLRLGARSRGSPTSSSCSASSAAARSRSWSTNTALQGYGAFKAAVGESIADGLRPIQEAYAGLSDSEVERGDGDERRHRP